jgi:NAD(P)-dependent dehydrogenase (short-subunit alcohol dehydrogenase family)
MVRSGASPARTALVTGGNRGIGYETCRQLARRGMRVVLTGRAPRLVREAAAALRNEGLHVRGERFDVKREDAAQALASRLSGAGIHVDVLVNNAGVYPAGGVLDAPPAAFREALEVHLLGALRACRAFVPGMLEARYGRVVNVSSGYGSFREGLEGPAAYSLTKAALNALTVKLASEVRGDVKVNGVCPGWVRTRMGGPGARRSVEKGAETVVWLATLPRSGPNGGFFRDRRRIGW